MFDVTSEGASVLVQPPEKRIKYSFDDLSKEIHLLENRGIKTGISNCKNATFFLDEQKIDLLNITDEKMSLINFDNYPSVESATENIRKKFRKSRSRQLDGDNSFLNHLGQSITSKLLGENFQVIPYKFVIYEKYDFRLPRENIKENGLKKLLIVVCPTYCKGGKIYFPEMRKKFIHETKKLLSFVLFDINTQYHVSQVTEGLRSLIVYKIYEDCFQLELKSLTVFNVECVKTILQNVVEKNIVIPMTEGNNTQKICDDMKLKYERVYSNQKCPELVYSYVSDDPDYHPDEHWPFKHLKTCSIEYHVGAFVNLPNQLNSEQLTRYCRYSDSYLTHGIKSQSCYYCFILLNPCRDYRPTMFKVEKK
ncbi:uncharacterized protein LOC122505187 isoform X2 [Leptopilina heterotoma]|uniref:uncharacterized protein LOC122505187 isoform X2 n=1 Tax=Leptopilina heterotoma TaxID=63436 RepID=UPI001CA93D51|nr:uncharacterized protein LOC122505187 isoform X2 [Leptopilina heterotoma]